MAATSGETGEASPGNSLMTRARLTPSQNSLARQVRILGFIIGVW